MARRIIWFRHPMASLAKVSFVSLVKALTMGAAVREIPTLRELFLNGIFGVPKQSDVVKRPLACSSTDVLRLR